MNFQHSDQTQTQSLAGLSWLWVVQRGIRFCVTWLIWMVMLALVYVLFGQGPSSELLSSCSPAVEGAWWATTMNPTNDRPTNFEPVNTPRPPTFVWGWKTMPPRSMWVRALSLDPVNSNLSTKLLWSTIIRYQPFDVRGRSMAVSWQTSLVCWSELKTCVGHSFRPAPSLRRVPFKLLFPYRRGFSFLWSNFIYLCIFMVSAVRCGEYAIFDEWVQIFDYVHLPDVTNICPSFLHREGGGLESRADHVTFHHIHLVFHSGSFDAANTLCLLRSSRGLLRHYWTISW